jgi:hypothetical protein
VNCNHDPDELIGYLVGGETPCDECDELATHDLHHTVLCCKHYQEELENPGPPLPPREDFHSDG